MTHTVSRIISDDTLSCIIQIESAGNPNARAKTSSATGLGQFIDATWMAVVSKRRPDLLKGRTKAQVLALRNDPDIAIEILARFTEDNAQALGASYSDGDLYLAHFAGVAAAKRLLKASAETPVSGLMSAAAINANASILKGKTVGQVRAWASRKMSNAKGKGWIAKLYRGPAVVEASQPPNIDTTDSTPVAAAHRMSARQSCSSGLCCWPSSSRWHCLVWSEFYQ